MSIIDHPNERERLHDSILLAEAEINHCQCRTRPCLSCECRLQQIAELRAACEALDHDEDQSPAITPDQRMGDMTDYEPVPEGEYLHPGDEFSCANGCWTTDGSFHWGERVYRATTVRRRRVLDIDLPSLLDKAKKLAKSLTDPVQRERLLYTIQQQTAALASNLSLTMKEIENASRA